jgi:putative ABC transport system permease protein
MREPIIPTRSRDRIVADNREELAGWIDERAADLVARGMPTDVARRRALEEFGDVEGAERYAGRQDVAADRHVRALLWVEELGSDLRIAARTLVRTPTVTAVVLLTFALGIGATTAVFSVVHAMLLRRLPYGAEESLVYLPAVDNGVIRSGLGGARHSAAALVVLRERTTSFSGIAGVAQGNFILTGNGDPEQLAGAELTPDAFDVLQARPAIGRIFGASEESGPASRVVVLLDGLWRRRFGADTTIVGRTIELSGERRQVIGVMAPGFRVPTYEHAEFLAPRGLANLLANPNNSQVRFLRLFARVKPGVSTAAAQADLNRTMRTLRADLPQSLSGIDTRMMPIRTAVAGEARPRLLVLMGAAVFVLLIACANVAGILLSRAIARRHELAVRVALGAGRRRLIRQFLAEGTVLASFGAGLGLLVAQFGIVALRQIATTALPIGTSFALEPRVALFAVGAAIAAAFASALLPALAATQAVGMALRRDDGRASPSRATRRMRLGLVAAQLAVSVVLLVGAGLLLRTLHRLSSLDLGYTTERALTFRLQFTQPKSNAEQDAFWASIYEQLRGIPAVLAVGGGNIPMSGQSTVTGLAIEGRPVENGRLPDVRYTPASDDYFTALGIPIVRGRAFTSTDRDGAPLVAVVSAGLAKQLWPGGDPLGARVKPGPDGDWSTIVGVAGDVRMGGADAPQPSVYTSQRQDHWRGGGAVVIRAAGDPQALAAGIRQVVNRVDPTLPVIGLRTLEDFRQRTPAIAERRLQMQLMLVFAFVALAVSAIGVYGVSAYATEARRREFGIRLALGASRRRVLWLALGDGASVAILGALAGVPLAWVLASRLRDLLYAVAPFDPLTVGAVLGALLLVALAASIVPARRATLIDPARTMRTN